LRPFRKIIMTKWENWVSENTSHDTALPRYSRIKGPTSPINHLTKWWSVLKQSMTNKPQHKTWHLQDPLHLWECVHW
jgi:hypothetical protein